MEHYADAITIEGEFTADHLTQQYGYCWALFLREESLLHQVRSQLMMRRGLFVLGFACLLLFAIFFTSGAHVALQVSAFVVGIVTLFFAFATANVFSANYDPKQRHRDLTIGTLMGRGVRTDALLGSARMTFDASGVAFVNGLLSWRASWDAVHELLESEGSFGIDTPWDGLAVPKAWFDGAEETRRFRDSIEAWSGKAFDEVDVPQTAPDASEVLGLRSRIRNDASAAPART